LTGPRQALDAAGADTSIVSLKPGQVRAWKFTEWGEQFPVDMAVEHADPAAFDALLRHLDRGDVASVVKDGCGAIADFANGRDRYLAADVRSEAGCQVGAREALQTVELGTAYDKPDRTEFG